MDLHVAIELPIVDAIPKERADAARNRAKVLAAAQRLFDRCGAENVSMDMIAAEAGVGKGTLFRRFGDRAGLAQAVLEEQTIALQESIIRGPAPLGPGAPPAERLKALAAAHLDLMAGRADILAAAEFGVRLDSAPYAFYRMHVGVLVREACPEADWELLTDMLLAPLAADMYVSWVRGRGMTHERILASYGMLVDRVLPLAGSATASRRSTAPARRARPPAMSALAPRTIASSGSATPSARATVRPISASRASVGPSRP